MFGGDGAEGALEEDALERFVSAEGAAPSCRLSGLTDDRRQAGVLTWRAGTWRWRQFHGSEPAG
jgi:hypothetical protein